MELTEFAQRIYDHLKSGGTDGNHSASTVEIAWNVFPEKWKRPQGRGALIGHIDRVTVRYPEVFGRLDPKDQHDHATLFLKMSEHDKQKSLIQGYCPAYVDNRPSGRPKGRGKGKLVYIALGGGETYDFMDALCVEHEDAWNVIRKSKPGSIWCVPKVVPINGLCEPVLENL